MRPAPVLVASASALLSLLVAPAWAKAPVTNQTILPPPPAGVFKASARIAINGTAAATWTTLLDFPNYPNWNPFVRCACLSLHLQRRICSLVRWYRSAVLCNELLVPYPPSEQVVAENKRVIFNVQIPPLPAPVDASTPPNPLNAQVAVDNITHVEPALMRAAWKATTPDKVLESERWSGVSVIRDGPEAGMTLYESYEVYKGTLAIIVQALYEEGLKEAFGAQATALKARIESNC
jgi:hypothetical protein